jgi:TolA-binding protein
MLIQSKLAKSFEPLRAFFFIAGLSFVATGCAQRIEELDEKIADIQQRTSLLEAKTGGPVGNDRELLEGQKLADVRSQLSTLRNDATVLSGKIEALEFENKRLSARTDQIVADLEAKSRVRKSEPAPEPAANAPDSDYEAGLKAHQDGDFPKAEKHFEAFISKHPKAPLADHALYWIADGYMAQKMYKKAISKFQDLVEHYPKSQKRCDAIGRQILGFKALNMQKEANVFTQLRDSECK